MMRDLFSNFKVPKYIETPDFVLIPLVEDLAKLDYEAVMSSIKRIKGTFGNDWPPEDLTFKEEIDSLKIKEKEFKDNQAFTYSVLNLNKNKCLGCVYFYPNNTNSYDTVCFIWAIDNEHDRKVYSFVKDWIKEWPFKSVGFPGREIDWEEWNTPKET